MATRGLVRSGQPYEPRISNDPGEYNYFYVDFRQELQPFSLGMWNASIVVHDSVQLTVTGVGEAWTNNNNSVIFSQPDLSVGTFTGIQQYGGKLTLEFL